MCVRLLNFFKCLIQPFPKQSSDSRSLTVKQTDREETEKRTVKHFQKPTIYWETRILKSSGVQEKNIKAKKDCSWIDLNYGQRDAGPSSIQAETSARSDRGKQISTALKLEKGAEASCNSTLGKNRFLTKAIICGTIVQLELSDLVNNLSRQVICGSTLSTSQICHCVVKMCATSEILLILINYGVEINKDVYLKEILEDILYFSKIPLLLIKRNPQRIGVRPIFQTSFRLKNGFHTRVTWIPWIIVFDRFSTKGLMESLTKVLMLRSDRWLGTGSELLRWNYSQLLKLTPNFGSVHQSKKRTLKKSDFAFH